MEDDPNWIVLNQTLSGLHVDALILALGVPTPYTPYQPEVSQGTLQVMFEYQTAICELTGLRSPTPPTTTARAPWPPRPFWRTSRTGARGSWSPAVCTRTPARRWHDQRGWGIESWRSPLRDGVTDPEALTAAVDEDIARRVLALPNFLGAVEDLEALADAAQGPARCWSCLCDPLALGILRPPGELGADVARGRGPDAGQPARLRRPVVRLLRRQRGATCAACPGRIAGETTDVDGRRGFVLTLQTREQHIRREKATLNICTAQALNALAA